MKKRILSFLLCLSLILPAVGYSSSISAAAQLPGGNQMAVSGAMPYTGVDFSIFSSVVSAAADFLPDVVLAERQFLLDKLVEITGGGDVGTLASLQERCVRLNAAIRNYPSFLKTLFGEHPDPVQISNVSNMMQWIIRNQLYPFKIRMIEVTVGSEIQEQYVIVDNTGRYILADSLGQYPYAVNVTDKFVIDSSLVNVHLCSLDVLTSKYTYLVENGLDQGSSIKTIRYKNESYDAIVYSDDFNNHAYVYCDEFSMPYLVRRDSGYEAGNSREPTVVVNPSGDTFVVEEDAEMKFDITNGLYYMPDGTIAFIDNLIYNPDNKTYTVTAYNSYNTTNNTYVEYNTTNIYFIEYTSVTYIGSTGEYTEEYKYYYELPDGRSSADLTADELEALNLNIDVLPYIRSADDTSIRALYHFDGDTLDSSYWSHIGNFGWDKGASITYLEANAFNGCLYLDETEHQFHIQLPSNIGSKDFTMQFRYYQSYTAAPQLDSYVSIDGKKLIQFNGASLLDGSGTALNAISIGNWQEICLQRIDGTLSIYLNGVPVGSAFTSIAFGDSIDFVFGSSQQTYKYFDEFRFVSEAVYPTTGYTPSSVPFDTNLALVLPDSVLPVADAFWTFDSSKVNLLSQYELDDFWGDAYASSPYFKPLERASGLSHSNIIFPSFGYWTDNTSLYSSDGLGFSVLPWALDSYTDALLTLTGLPGQTYAPCAGIFTLLQFAASSGNMRPIMGDYCFSIVTSDGVVHSLPFTVPKLSGISFGSVNVIASMNVGDYLVRVYNNGVSRGSYNLMWLQITAPFDAEPLEWVYWELVEGNSTDLTATYTESVVVMDKEDLNTPSLAVRTDQTITGYQIGGIRPSLPEKGQVWALVESSRITSLQIYNGQAWVEVDGRIWTGERWVPYYAYDVLLLKDMFDVVGSNPDKEFIYTESGFWSWLQKAWGQMMTKLDDIYVAITGEGVVDTSGCHHAYAITSQTDATCTDPGKTIFTCALCGDQYQEIEQALGHDWLPSEVIEDTYTLPPGVMCPDCAGEDFTHQLEGEQFRCSCSCGCEWMEDAHISYGKKIYTCSRCEETYEESTDPDSGLFAAIGNFLADGITWVTDKLTQLIDSFSGIHEIFQNFMLRIQGSGDFSGFLGAAFATLPEELTDLLWFSIVSAVALLVWIKWFG